MLTSARTMNVWKNVPQSSMKSVSFFVGNPVPVVFMLFNVDWVLFV